jgi:hypothetical protein
MRVRARVCLCVYARARAKVCAPGFVRFRVFACGSVRASVFARACGRAGVPCRLSAVHPRCNAMLHVAMRLRRLHRNTPRFNAAPRCNAVSRCNAVPTLQRCARVATPPHALPNAAGSQ